MYFFIFFHKHMYKQNAQYLVCSKCYFSHDVEEEFFFSIGDAIPRFEILTRNFSVCFFAIKVFFSRKKKVVLKGTFH